MMMLMATTTVMEAIKEVVVVEAASDKSPIRCRWVEVQISWAGRHGDDCLLVILSHLKYSMTNRFSLQACTAPQLGPKLTDVIICIPNSIIPPIYDAIYLMEDGWHTTNCIQATKSNTYQS
jgi:hypothetical protein